MQELTPAPGRSRITLFWPGALLGESKSRHKDLRAAHCTLDARVERLYRVKRFANDTERVQHLFERYATLSAPSLPPSKHYPCRASPSPPPAARRKVGVPCFFLLQRTFLFAVPTRCYLAV